LDGKQVDVIQRVRHTNARVKLRRCIDINNNVLWTVTLHWPVRKVDEYVGQKDGERLAAER